jgi:hypothetical protein
MNFLKKLNLVLERQLNLGRTRYVVVLVDILQFLGELKVPFKPYCKQPFYPEENERIPFGWNLFYDSRYNQLNFI